MRWWVCALALLVSCSADARSYGAKEFVHSFYSRIKIGEQGELNVTETIDIQAEGERIKHGILRDFPTDYQDRLGRRVTVPFELIGVMRDGQPEPVLLKKWANGVRLQIGDAAKFVTKGRHVYEISYRTRHQIGFFDDHDELYWNVNGNGWDFFMERVTADVTLPRGVYPEYLRSEAYTGRLGARGRDYTTFVTGGGAHFHTTKFLAPHEGLTIVFSFPKGIVAPPTWFERVRRALQDNAGELTGAAGLLLLLAFLFWRWWQVGRDPREGPVFPRYEPPQDLGPAATRYVDRMAYDDRCFAAALLGMGARGYLTIWQGGGIYTIDGTGKRGNWLPEEEPLSGLIPPPGASGTTIGGGYVPEVKQAREYLSQKLASCYGEKLFSRNSGSLVIGVLIGLGTVFSMLALDAALPVLIAGGVVIGIVLLMFARLLPAYTPDGRKRKDEIAGLRLYLSMAEKDDLARQQQPPRTAEEFARFLPYALALDVEKTWANGFAAVLGAAVVAEAVTSYYQSSDESWKSGDIGAMSDSIGSMSDGISSAASPPGSSSGTSDSSSSSSGGGGGGGSGGGGGGGGGGGW